MSERKVLECDVCGEEFFVHKGQWPGARDTRVYLKATGWKKAWFNRDEPTALDICNICWDDILRIVAARPKQEVPAQAGGSGA